jgi:hypothetical protein
MKSALGIIKSELIPFRKLLSLAAAAGLLTCCATVGQANDLINGSLDAVSLGPQNNPTPTSWSVSANKVLSGAHFDGLSSEPWANVLEIGGQGVFFKPFQGTVGDEITVYLYQDVPAAPNTKYTLSGYAAGEPNFSAFFSTNTLAPQALFVVEFLDAGNNVISSNGLDLVTAGLPSAGPGSMSLFTTPQFTAPANTATVRAGALMQNAYGTSGAQSFFVDYFVLASEVPPGGPVITQPPTNTTVSPGGTATFTVGLENPAGASYQWQFQGNDLVDGGDISGATSATLSIANASASDVGRYRVRVTNPIAFAISGEARLALLEINLFPVILITGQIGDTYRVDYANRLDPATWIPLSTNTLATSPQMVVDTTSPMSTNRFYRAVFVP